MNDDNKALKKVTFYDWVDKHFTPLSYSVSQLEKKVASINGTLKILVPLVIATFLAIISLAVIIANGD